MSRMTRFGIFAVIFALWAVPTFAEDKASSSGSAAPAASTSDQDASASPTPVPDDTLPAVPDLAAPEAAPAPPAPVAPPALKPITITFSGEVASVAATENPPMVTIQDRYGVKKEIAVPSDAKITSGAASKALSDLKAGDKVTVEYTYDVATGKRTAQMITLGEAAAAQPGS